MIYIEYCSRRPGVDLKEFHDAWKNGQEGWGGSYGEDQLAWAGGRTWRLGPEPEYVAVWRVAEAGFERFDDWDRIFKSGDADNFEDPFFAAARIEVGGCYKELTEPVHMKGKRYFVEYFAPTGTDSEIKALYQERAARHAGHDLLVLATRIGKLAPDPGGIAVWSMDNFAEMGNLAQDLDGTETPVQLATVGVYADVGEEEL